VALAAVGLDVKQLPPVLVEIRPAGRRGGVHGVGEPALLPDAAGAEHRVELPLLAGGCIRIIQGHFDTHPVKGFLRNAPDGRGRCDVQQVVHGRGDVTDVDVVVADFSVRLDSLGPADDCGVGDAALVRGVAFEQFIGRVERHRPSDRVVVVRLGAAEVVHQLQAFLHGVDVAVEEFDLVDRSVGTALATGTVVGDDHDDRVVELTRLIQIVKDAADLGVGVGQEAGEDLGHPCEQPLLVITQRFPRAHRVLRRPGFTVGSLDIQVRVDGRQLGVRWDDAELLLVLEHDFAVALVAHIETARILVGPFLEDVMRRMACAGADVGEPRLVGCDHLGIADEFDCPVGDVLRQVVAVLGCSRRRDGVVVVDEFGIPLVGLAAHESVKALEPPSQRPMPFGGSKIRLFERSEMPLAHAVGVVAVLDKYLRKQRGVVGDPPVATGKAVGELLDGGHPDRGWVAARQQRRPRG